MKKKVLTPIAWVVYIAVLAVTGVIGGAILVYLWLFNPKKYAEYTR